MCQCVIFVQIDLRKGYDLIWRLYISVIPVSLSE